MAPGLTGNLNVYKDGDRPVVYYCVRGHEISQGAGEELRRLGIDTRRYLEGGIDG
jgi:rhodanese-related sulfurtransferase